jgi:hypothetical protein
MKVILPFQSSAAIRASGDDVIPQNAENTDDLIALIGDTYKFSARPKFPPNTPPVLMQNLVFQAGVLVTEQEKITIHQLALVANGDIATASTTDLADLILDDLIAKLDSLMNFRYAHASLRRVYQSNLVVEFEKGLEEKIEAIKKIEHLLSREIDRPSLPFKIKRLAFGGGDPPQPGMLTLDAIENGDFVMERRHGAPYAQNRYFCSAPVRTKEHIRILETLEREFG